MKDLKLEMQGRREEPASEESMLKAKIDELEKEMKSLKMEIEKLRDTKKDELEHQEIVFDYNLDDATSFFKPTVKSSRYSQVFHVAGLRWSVSCELNEEKGKKYLAFYLNSENITEGSWADTIYELRLLSSSDKVVKTSRYCDRFKRSISLGEHQFVSYDELKKNGLIVKDRVKLQIHLRVDKVK